MENFFSFTTESSVEDGDCFSPASGEKKKDAERYFIFHIYFAPMDTVCSRTTQTSQEAGGKRARCDFAGERISKRGREPSCHVKACFLRSNLRWTPQVTGSFQTQWPQKPSVSTVLAREWVLFLFLPTSVSKLIMQHLLRHSSTFFR